MPDLQIELTHDLTRAIIKALDDLAITRGDDLREMLYESSECLAQVAGEVDALRALEKIAADRDLTDAEMDALNKARNQTVSPWMRKKAGAILVTLAQPMRDQIAEYDGVADDRPGQDAGAALVGVECYVWGEMYGKGGVQGPTKIDGYDPDGEPTEFAYEVLDKTVNGVFFAHARPAYLGKPSA